LVIKHCFIMDITNPQIPPRLSPTKTTGPGLLPLGGYPEEREPIPNLPVAIEAILRQPRRVILQLKQPGSSRLIGIMLFGVVIGSAIYGGVVGSFSMGNQIWMAAIKVALGLLVTGIICLPSLYIFACISGSRASFSEVCGLVVGLMLIMTLLLLGFAPVAWLFSQSTQSLACMGMLHLGFWLVATLFGIRFMNHGFSYSEARSAAGLNTWIIIFVLVALQMTTALRPILGKAKTFLPETKQSFVSHWAECVRTDPATPQ
jgi:hypothetical protein